jgi:hypothetical protein
MALVIGCCALAALPSFNVAALERGSPSKELGVGRDTNRQDPGSYRETLPPSDSGERATTSPPPETACIARTLCSLENTGCYDPEYSAAHEPECRAHCRQHCR